MVDAFSYPCDSYLHFLKVCDEYHPAVVDVTDEMTVYKNLKGGVLHEEITDDCFMRLIPTIRESYSLLPILIRYNGVVVYGSYFEEIVHKLTYLIMSYKNIELTESDLELIKDKFNRVIPDMYNQMRIEIYKGKLKFRSETQMAGVILFQSLKYIQKYETENA